MRNRWAILAVLFAVRLTMGFQFQSVAAVAPLLERELGVSLADIGVLIGLYFTPGVALALPERSDRSSATRARCLARCC